MLQRSSDVLFLYSRTGSEISQFCQSSQRTLTFNLRGYFCVLLLHVFIELFLVILSFGSSKFVTPVFIILRSFGVFIVVKCCGSCDKLNTYFLRCFDSNLFFREWIF